MTEKSYAQDLDVERISFGITSQYNIPGGDLGSFWGNAFGAGPTIQYKISKDFSFEGNLIFSYLKPLDKKNEMSLPKITLLNMPAGIKYYINFAPSQKQLFIVNFQAGIENNTFIYSGEGSELVEENPVESEFGVFLSAGIEFFLTNKISTEFFSAVQNIFSLPENIRIYNFGVKLFIN